MKTIIAGLIISLAVALAPVPRITVADPNLLYAAAMYETARGNTDSALHLMHRAEQAQQSARAAHPDPLQTASHRSTLFTAPSTDDR